MILNAYSGVLDLRFPSTIDCRPRRRWIDTGLDSPDDIVSSDEAPDTPAPSYSAKVRSIVMLISGGK